MVNNQSQVAKLLKADDWLPDGQTWQNDYRIITVASYPLAGGEVKSGGHPRFKKGEWKVSVGKRVVYFYKPCKGKPYYHWDGVTFKTKDLEGIKEHLDMKEKKGW